MSGATKLGRLTLKRPMPRAWLNPAGRAGTRRLVLLGVAGVSVAALAAVLTVDGQRRSILSFDARMQAMDPLPGGLHSTPEQDALAFRADATDADGAAKRGHSYTPPIAPSVRLVAGRPTPEESPIAARPSPPPPKAASKPSPVYAQTVAVPPPPATAPVVTPAVATGSPKVIRVQQSYGATQQQVDPAYRDLFSGWETRAPRTDVILPPTSADDPGADAQLRPAGAARAAALPAPPPVVQSGQAAGHVLIPAGRGIYAHPVLALSSDASSPAVFQADSGLIAGDRMIGSFSRQNSRLIIRINSVVHNGEPISVDGVVIAPETMDASVASSVDQHYLARFILPAAAAFVQGLGAAIATTSNTTAVLSPFGGATTTTNLNLPQQLGIAAGTAASNIGSTLNQAAPRGPTITLDANVAVGVMFLSNVVSQR